MSHYRKIDTRIWNDAKFSAMTDDGKIAFLFILTHPMMTPLGGMRATADGLGAELGWHPGRFEDAIGDAIRDGILDVNRKASYMGAKNFLKYNKPEGPNSVLAWPKFLEMIPECPERSAMLTRALATLGAKNQLFNESKISLDAIRDAIRDAIGDVIEMVSEIREHRTQSTEHRIEDTPLPPRGECDVIKPSRKERNARERKAYDAEFEQAWEEIVSLTPNASKAPSAKAWATCRKAGLGVDDIIGWYRDFSQDKTERRFVTGFHKIAEPVVIRKWVAGSSTADKGPSQEELRAMRDRFLAAEEAR